MNKLKIKFIGGGLSLAMVIGLSVYAPINTVEAADMSGKLVVIHTNDMHGHFEKDIEEGSLGISSVAALKGYYEIFYFIIPFFEYTKTATAAVGKKKIRFIP